LCLVLSNASVGVISYSTALLALGFVLLWNSGFIGAEFGVAHAEPFTLLLWRYVALALILFGYLAVRRRALWYGFGDAALSSVVGVLAHAVWLSCVTLALQTGVPAGIVALIIALQPLLTATLSARVVGEPTPPKRWLGLLVAFSGVLITVLARAGSDLRNGVPVTGYLLPFGSVLAMTAAVLIQRRMEIHRPPSGQPMAVTMLYQSVASAMVLAAPAIFFENLAVRWEPGFLLVMAWLILAVSLGAYVLMWLLLARIEANRMASLFYFGPPVTMVMAWAAFGDTIKASDLAGLLVVLVGVLLAARR